MSFTVIPPVVGAKPRQLDKPAEPDEQVTDEQLDDRPRMLRFYMRLLRDIAALLRRWSPDTLEFEDRSIDDDTGATKFRFEHGFGGRVRWFPVDWTGVSTPALIRHEDTTNDTLVLVSFGIGTLTLRIERAG